MESIKYDDGRESMPSYAILEAPSNLGLKPSGVEGLSRALLSAGLQDGLGAEYAGRVEPAPFDPHRDPQTGLVNGGPILSYSKDLANKVKPLIEQKKFPIVLGGDCSILLGTMLAMRRSGHYGLFFIDGHADFYQPDAEPSGEVASMELALVSGRGPSLLADIDGLGPLVGDQDIVAFDFRDEVQARLEGSQDIKETPIRTYSWEQVQILGINPASTESVAHLIRTNLSGFWVHLDVDVLSDEEMPAVDYRQYGGLSFVELSEVLHVLIATGRAVGITITIFNPALDPLGALAPRINKCIIDGLRGKNGRSVDDGS